MMQARQEPHAAGPGKPFNHYRGALYHNLISNATRLRRRGVEREETWGVSLTIRLWVWGSVVSSHSGVQGGAPAENGFYAWGLEAIWKTPNVARAGKTFLPPPMWTGLP